jgi:hypothetical protein
MPSFGRLSAPDDRDRQYPMRLLLQETPPPVAPVRRWFHHTVGKILNQGETGTCVGHASRQWLSSSLLMTKTGPDAFTIYREACLRDPWPGNDHGDLQFGTSVRAAMQALQARGHLSAYYWADTVGIMDRWLREQRGVLILGTNWYGGMNEPDQRGMIHMSGSLQGGHSYVISGANADQERFRLINSWGLSWGQYGRAWISYADVQRLLNEDGECVTAIERQLIP